MRFLVLCLFLSLCACRPPATRPVTTVDDSVESFLDHGRYTLQTLDTNQPIVLLDTAHARAWVLDSAGHWSAFAPPLTTNQTHP